MSPTTAVLYHSPCYDGFGAAWAFRHFHTAVVDGWNLEFIPAGYEDVEPPRLPADTAVVYMLDFTLKRHRVLEMAEKVDKLFIIDHHSSAKKDLEGIWQEGDGNISVNFDMEHSGAILTWKCFSNDDPPELLRYIEDRDLWKKSLPGSDAVASALRAHPFDFDVWDKLMDMDIERLCSEGELILKFTDQQVSNICDTAYLTSVGPWANVPVVNTSVFWSEVGQELLRRYPDAGFVGSYTMLSETKRRWSLRSEDHRFAVDNLAIRLGEKLGDKPGGGHRNAAGFVETLA